MNQRSPSLWLVAVVALAGIFRFSSPTAAPPLAAGAATSESAALQPSTATLLSFKADEVYKLLAEHYLIDDVCGVPSAPSKIKSVTRVVERSADDGSTREGPPVPKSVPECVRQSAVERFVGDNGRVVIAMVPDPTDTRISYRFDEMLEAIQTGAQDSGYVLERFSLPWPTAARAGADGKTEEFRLHPGAVLFRKADASGPPEPLLVLLVGETPTAGVQSRAFVDALEGACLLARDAKDIRIIGPNFSGSVESLRDALSKWSVASDGRSVRFFSGNTTSLKARKRLDEFSDVPVEFYGTVLPDVATEKAIDAYFEQLEVNNQRVATLVEADSSYGAGVLSDEGRKEQPQDKKESVRYRLPYPMQISQVRTRYHREVTTAATALTDASVRPSLRLSGDENAGYRDKPEPYAPSASANIAELALTAIIDTLYRERITHVGLYGTDTRDKLFLAQLIRSRFRNIQFFTDDSDILYAHSDYASDLWGMLVFSTYPLVSQERTWLRDRPKIPDGGKLRQFSSQMAQSIHNATRLAMVADTPKPESTYLMAMNPLVKDSQNSKDPPRPLLPGYGPPMDVPAKGDRPHLWVTAVGSNGLWPVSVINPWSGEASHGPDVEISYSRSFLVLLAAFNALCVFHYRRVGRPLFPFKASTADTPARTLVEAWQAEFVTKSADAGYFVTLLMVSLVFTSFVVLFPFRVIAEDILGWALLGWSLISVFLMADASALSLFSAFSAKGGRVLGGWWRAAVLIIVAEVLAVSYLLWTGDALIPGPTRMMFFERSTRLSSGLSPLLPFVFLAAGVALWLTCLVSRASLTASMAEVRPYPENASSPSTLGLCGLADRINDALTDAYRWGGREGKSRLWTLLSLLIALLLFWGAFAKSFFRTSEPIGVHLVFFPLSFFLAVGLVRTVRDFARISYQLHRLLQRLAFHRLAEAFTGLSPKSARGLSTDLMASPPPLGELQASFDDLLDMSNAFRKLDRAALSQAQIEALPTGMKEMIDSTREVLQSELANAGKSESKLPALPSETQKLLCKHTRTLFQSLSTYWDTETFHGLKDDSREALKHAFGLCERFVALQIVSHLNAVFVCLRYLIVCAGCILLCLLLATACYPYYMRSMMMNSVWGLALTCSAIFLAAFMHFSTSELVRNVRTKDGVVQSSYRAAITQVVLFIVIPAFAFFSSHFPGLSRWLVSWVGPAMKSINL